MIIVLELDLIDCPSDRWIKPGWSNQANGQTDWSRQTG